MSKYLKDNRIELSDLLHDLTGLKGPMSFVQELIRKQNYEKAQVIQAEILKKIDLIEAELRQIPIESSKNEVDL